MLEFFIKRPITTLMFVLFWVVMGVVSYPKMNVERMPPMDLPMVSATLLYPGAGPSEIETQVVKPVENAISKVSGIKKITSQVYQDYAFIMTEFNLGESAMEKQQEVKGQVDSILYDLPDALEQPVVKRLNVMQMSVMDLAISGTDLRDAYDFVDKVLSQRITGIRGVASVDIFGGRKRAIRVFLDPQRMAAKGISVSGILEAVNKYNLNVPAGKIETRWSSNTVRFMGEFADVKDVENMPLITSEGLVFRMKDIGEIADSAKDPETGGRYLDDDVLIISVTKAEDGNAVKISDEMFKRLDGYNALIKKSLGDTAEMRIISDAARSIRNEVSGTINGIVVGILLTILTLLAFTKNWRSTIIASVVIPVSLISGFLWMNGAGFSINSMTLLAMASALGTLIGNAIILIESALTLMDAGMDPEQAAIQGTKKTAVAILAGVGTNIVVFLPLAFMKGIAGLFMNQFGMTVVYLTLMSLLFSFTLTPMMIAKFLRPTKKKKTKKPAAASRPLAWFRPCFDSQLRHPWRWVGYSALLLIFSAMLMKYVGSEFSPSADTDEIQITARSPMGATYEKSLKLAKRIEEKMAGFPEIRNASVKIGRRGLQNINITANLVPLSERDPDKIVAQRLVAKLAEIPDAEFQIKAGETGGGGGNIADTVINVTGDDDRAREKLADDLIAEMNKMDEVQSAILAAQRQNEEIQFIPDKSKMNAWNATNAQVGGAIRTALYGDDTLKYREKGEEYPLVVEFAKDYKTLDAFGDILVSTSRGMVPVSELGKLEYRPASRNIYRVDKHRLTEIYVNLGKSTIGPVRAKIMQAVAEMDIPEGHSVRFGGMSEMQDETSSEMMNTFLLASILTFILLAAIMNSLAHPFTICIAIITSFVGVFSFMFLTGATMNISAMLSIIMLVGLAVNNDILLLEPTVSDIAKGMEPEKALWGQYIDKFRMIMMTTIAIIAGMLPQLFSSDMSKLSMAAVLIGGMAGGLLFSFILTPSLFILVERAREKIIHNS
ncbi:MAG: efflux RND transporter permease subunit [Rickettsiales bacterium]|jgi:HAE1 family hydrophobic/amphiphilic exporter-1|nr:efflux RND transporter permease subunit [Rickettsiales bacterium]